MDFDLTTKEGRTRHIKYCLNVVALGFDGEVNTEILNKKCVKDYIEGLITVEELSDKLAKGQDYDRNFKLMEEAKAIAQLDNKAEIDAEDLEML